MQRLLRLRPDLAAPAPPDLATLANRLGVRSSVTRALDALDLLTLRVLDALVLLGPASAKRVHELFGAVPVSAADVSAGLERLAERGLAWGDDARWHPHGATVEHVGVYPAGLGRPVAELREYGLIASDPDPTTVSAQLDALPADERGVLDRLAAGPPAGTVRDTRFGVDEPGPVDRLVERGLLVRLDPVTVELPREIGLVLRADRPLGAITAAAPDVTTAGGDPERVDATGTTAVLESLRLVDRLARDWGDEPPAQLRSGGLGVRDLRRSAKELELDESHASALIEVAVAADLISAPTGREEPWRPTTDYDVWSAAEPADRWLRIATAWLQMTRQPSLVGERDERGKPRAALSFDVERAAAPTVRRDVLRLLADLPSGTVPGGADAVLDRLAWLRPRRIGAVRTAAAAALVEAEQLGMTGGGGLTSYGRAVLDGDRVAARAALMTALPTPVDEFLLQPDLSVVVPGPPTVELARELDLVADLESGGGASVYRVSEASVRRALDAGRSAADVQALFATRSRTPVPQALSYLVDDLARRHGALRVGTAESYVRCDDTALLDRVLSDRTGTVLQLRRIAPTVALSGAAPDVVLRVLREAGYVPAAEDGTGATVTAGPEPLRSRPRRSASARAVAAEPVPDAHLAEVVRRMRTGDDLARTAHPVGAVQNVPGVTSARTFEVLREAIRSARRIWVAHVDASGKQQTSIIEPLSLGGGFLRGHDVDGGAFRSVPLHRITSVNVLADDTSTSE